MSSLSLSRFSFLTLFAFVAIVLGGADGCSSDPQVEGAKLYINNKEYDNALDNLDEALATNPDNVEALVLKAEVLRLMGGETPTAEVERRASLFADMTATVDRAVQLAPDDQSVIDAKVNAWAYAINEGNKTLRSDADPSDAAAYFRGAITLQPDSMQGPFGLGLAELRGANFEAAIEPLARAVELAPEDANTHEYLARAYLATDRATEAVEVLEAARDRFPDNDDLRTTLLNAYANAGMVDRAIAEYESEIASGRVSGEAEGLIRYNYGSLLLSADRIDEAIEQLGMAVDLNPDNPDAQYNMGAALQNKASALAREANETEDNAAANALIEERNGLLERALPYLQASRDLADAADQQNACTALFQVYTQLNRVDDANAVAECAGMSTN
ncbi:MAG: tetratricopeptide repeat protein [Bacteroidota bacterium]